MKLHLPSRLRKALLACLAAMAMHSLPATVASGSALIGGGAFVSFILSQQAKAADDDGDADQLSANSAVSEDADEVDILDSAVLGEEESELVELITDAVYGDAGIAPYTGEYGTAPIANSTWTEPEVDGGWGNDIGEMPTNPYNLSVLENTSNIMTIWGQARKLYGGEGQNLKLIRHSAANGNITHLQMNNGEGLKVRNLWLTSNCTGNNNAYSINEAGYLCSYT